MQCQDSRSALAWPVASLAALVPISGMACTCYIGIEQAYIAHECSIALTSSLTVSGEDEARTSGDEKATNRGSTATTVNLRGVLDRTRDHSKASGTASSSDQGSLRFDRFLDAEGSDQEDEHKKRARLRREEREARRAKARVSYSAVLVAMHELEQCKMYAWPVLRALIVRHVLQAQHQKSVHCGCCGSRNDKLQRSEVWHSL
jgi:hypothetical protein